MTEEDKKGLVINRIGAFSVDGDELSKKMSKVKQLPPINTNGIKYDLPE